jgi:hypothetical protein
VVLKLGHIGEQVRNTWEVFKCGAGEGWKSSTEFAKHEEVLQRVKEERNVLSFNLKMEGYVYWSHLTWNCRLKHVTEGARERRIEMTGRRGRRLKQLLDDHKEIRGP